MSVPLVDKVKEELKRMKKMGVITAIEEPTKWCAGMVVAPKPQGGIHICVDLTHLNKDWQGLLHPQSAPLTTFISFLVDQVTFVGHQRTGH